MTNPIDPKDIINQLSDGLTTLNFNLKDWEEILLIALENGAVDTDHPWLKLMPRDLLGDITQGVIDIAPRLEAVRKGVRAHIPKKVTKGLPYCIWESRLIGLLNDVEVLKNQLRSADLLE